MSDNTFFGMRWKTFTEAELQRMADAVVRAIAGATHD